MSNTFSEFLEEFERGVEQTLREFGNTVNRYVDEAKKQTEQAANELKEENQRAATQRQQSDTPLTTRPLTFGGHTDHSAAYLSDRENNEPLQQPASRSSRPPSGPVRSVFVR